MNAPCFKSLVLLGPPYIIGVVLFSGFNDDCPNALVLTEVPYNGCFYELNIWGIIVD